VENPWDPSLADTEFSAVVWRGVNLKRSMDAADHLDQQFTIDAQAIGGFEQEISRGMSNARRRFVSLVSRLPR
jgi:hypothetical protein